MRSHSLTLCIRLSTSIPDASVACSYSSYLHVYPNHTTSPIEHLLGVMKLPFKNLSSYFLNSVIVPNLDGLESVLFPIRKFICSSLSKRTFMGRDSLSLICRSESTSEAYKANECDFKVVRNNTDYTKGLRDCYSYHRHLAGN